MRAKSRRMWRTKAKNYVHTPDRSEIGPLVDPSEPKCPLCGDYHDGKC